MTCGLYMLRVLQSGLRLDDLDNLTLGMVYDIFTESGNDSCEYKRIATQADFDAFRNS